MPQSLTAIDPLLEHSWYRQFRGVGPLASEHIADGEHAMPQPSAGDAIPAIVTERARPGDDRW